MEVTLEALRLEVCRLNRELHRLGLVTWTAGNVSGRDPTSDRVVIKPSGVAYDQLEPKDMVVVNLDGVVLEGALVPSTDTATHLYIYRHLPEVRGVVHTHSPYATAWATVGREIPACTTSVAAWFGGPVPLAESARIGGEEIGAAVTSSLSRSPAVLVKNHGVFCVGASAEEAFRAAVRVEDVARIAAIASTLGDLQPLAPEVVLRERERHVRTYGQPDKRDRGSRVVGRSRAHSA